MMWGGSGRKGMRESPHPQEAGNGCAMRSRIWEKSIEAGQQRVRPSLCHPTYCFGYPEIASVWEEANGELIQSFLLHRCGSLKGTGAEVLEDETEEKLIQSRQKRERNCAKDWERWENEEAERKYENASIAESPSNRFLYHFLLQPKKCLSNFSRTVR